MPPSSKTTAYDTVPYPCGGLPQTHPERLSTLAALFGMKPPDLSVCRVLELGCGNGSNLIPMAVALPGASFVGLDLSGPQIEQGQEEVTQLGIGNLRLVHGDLQDFDTSQGPFDYIIGHGLYSWVPPPARAQIWRILQNCLSSQGVAYLSYNTFPGWHYRLGQREMMRFHTQHVTDPERRVSQGLAMVKFVADSIPSHLKNHADTVRHELARLSELPTNYLLHDDLGEQNQPFYFHEFVTDAARHGLQFLSEAEFRSMQDHRLPDKARSILREAGDVLVVEQYRDFLTANAFRQTLLCREQVPLRRDLSPEVVARFSARSAVRCQTERPQTDRPVPETFVLEQVSFSLADPVLKRALVFLAEQYPRAVPFAHLLAAACAADGDVGEPKTGAQSLCELLLALYGAGVLSLHTFEPPFERFPKEQPCLERFARHRIEAGKEVVTPLLDNLRFEEPFGRRVALLCDGTKTRQDLLLDLVCRVKRGEFPDELVGEGLVDDVALTHQVAARLEECLHRIAAYALFV